MNWSDITFPLTGKDENPVAVATGYMKTSFTITRDGNLDAETKIWTNNSLIGFTGGVSIILTDADKRPIWSTAQQRYGIDGQWIGRSDRIEKWPKEPERIIVPADILAITKGYYIEETHTPRPRVWEWMKSEEGLQKINLSVKLFEGNKGNIVMGGNINDTSINIGGGVDNSTVKGGEIHTSQSTGDTENKVVITIDKNVTNSAKIIGGKIYISADLKDEVQQFLEKLAQSPITQNEAVAAAAIEQEIKNKPTLKQRLISAFKAGGIEALKAIFNHPVVNIPVETIKGFLEAS